MEDLEKRFEVTRREITKEKALKAGAWLAPPVLAIIPALVFFVLFLFSSATPTAAMFFFLSLIALAAGFLFGLAVSGVLLYRRSKWLAAMRERIASDGIKTDEVRWFQNELTASEKKSLKEIESNNRLLADAYRETLASRLTAARILKSTRGELQLVHRRQNKLKILKGDASDELRKQLTDDNQKLSELRAEAEQMRVEAETRLQMIEAAARRGGSVADAEFALKRLSARAAELPLALESLKMQEDIKKELESEAQ